MKTNVTWSLAAVLATLAIGCASDSVMPPAGDLTQRAYIVSHDSDELTVIDLDKLEIIARVKTGGLASHMAELSADFGKIYVNASDSDQTIVVDARTFEITGRLNVGHHPTHESLSRDGTTLAIMVEGDDSITFVDTATDTEIKRLGGFFTPHFMRFAPDGRYAYVANINAHHISRVDLTTLEIDAHIPLDGFAAPPDVTLAPDEGGFGDVQIAADGVLYAAHNATGRVLVYDTVTQTKLPEIVVGARPWIVFAEHPFAEVPLRHLVPNFGDATITLIDGAASTRGVMASLPGDEEAYGVNFSSVTPERAFVMNRVREDIAVVDTDLGEIIQRIPVGGNTETASTTADGKYIVAAVSSANRVVVIDAATMGIVKMFDDVGSYPWSVTIPNGQNYCH